MRKLNKRKKSSPKKFKLNLKFLSLFAIVLIALGTLVLSRYITTTKNTSVVQPNASAGSLDCSGHGTNDDPQCDQQANPCHFSCNSNPQNIPSCCDDIKRTGDPLQCCFAARRVCRQDQCDGIPAGVVRQRCGQMWQNNCCPAYGSGCPFKPPKGYVPPVSPTPPAESIGPSTIVLTPLPSNPPIIPTDTLVPVPTNPPVASQTPIIPTELAQEPVSPILIIPTNFYAPTPTAIPTPTSMPVMQVIGNNIGDLFQKTKDSVLKFLSSVLP